MDGYIKKSDDLNVAMEQVEKVRGLGFLGRVTDRKRKRKIITSDWKEKWYEKDNSKLKPYKMFKGGR